MSYVKFAHIKFGGINGVSIMLYSEVNFDFAYFIEIVTKTFVQFLYSRDEELINIY